MSKRTEGDNQTGCIAVAIILLIAVFIVYKCENSVDSYKEENAKRLEEEQIAAAKEEVVPIIETNDLSLLRHRLDYYNNYYYTIKVTNIEFEKIENVYAYKYDQYSPPDFVDGLKLTVNFLMTNPYNKEMVKVHVPRFFVKGSERVVSRGERAMSSTDVIAEKDSYVNGTLAYTEWKYAIEQTSLIYDENVFKMWNEITFDFKPNETKEFKVIIPNKIVFGVQYILLGDFNDDIDSDTLKWDETAIEIEVESKSIISQMRLYRHHPKHSDKVVQKVIGNKISFFKSQD